MIVAITARNRCTIAKGRHNIYMNEKQMHMLQAIKTPQDIKQFQVIREFYDDKEPCVEVAINGINVEFMWQKDIDFVYQWQSCTKSFKQLRNAIKQACRLEELCR